MAMRHNASDHTNRRQSCIQDKRNWIAFADTSDSIILINKKSDSR